MGSGVVTIKTSAVPNGIAKDPYYGVITASGGCTPYTWKVASGALPAGVTMKTSSQTTSVTLSGTPTKAATNSFTVSATACGGHEATASYKIVVQATPNHVVDLNWKASTTKDVIGYNVYRGPDGSWWSKINVSPTASTAYSDSAVADSSNYYYATTAIDVKGDESGKSNVLKTAIP